MSNVSSEDRILAGFCHLMIVFSWMGTAAALVVWLVRKEKSDFVKKSVKQAVAYQLLALGILRGINLFYGAKPGFAFAITRYRLGPTLFGAGWIVVALVLLMYGLKGASAGFKGKGFKYPVIGDFVDKIFN